jgi:hypothetical protein
MEQVPERVLEQVAVLQPFVETVRRDMTRPVTGARIAENVEE